MKKLWPIEVWYKIWMQGAAKFCRFAKISCIHCFRFLFLFFFTFNPLETVSQHKISPFSVLNRTHAIFLIMYSKSLYSTQNISFLVPNRAHIHVHIEQCRFIFETT